jgi:hypothetical protein
MAACSQQAPGISGMNWRRGFFRIWLVLSALWVGWWIAIISLQTFDKIGDPRYPTWSESIRLHPEQLVLIPAMVFGPSIIALGVYAVFAWIARGFKD